MQELVLVSHRLVFFEESSPWPLLCRAEWGFLLILSSSSRHALLRKTGINSWFKFSVHIQLIIFLVELSIVWIRHLIRACVHILCTYIWDHFVLHLHSPLLFEGKWKSRWMVVQIVLFLRQQQVSSCQRSFKGTYCHFLDKIIYSLSNWISSKVEISLDFFYSRRRNSCCFTVDWKWVKWNRKRIFVLVYQLMGIRYIFAVSWINFAFLGSDSGVFDCDWGIFFSNGDGFFFP